MLKILKPEYVLPFAGSYVLGGKNVIKNGYLELLRGMNVLII